MGFYFYIDYIFLNEIGYFVLFVLFINNNNLCVLRIIYGNKMFIWF